MMIQAATSPGFSWTFTAGGFLITAAIVGAAATIIKAMFSIGRPIVRSWDEMQASIKLSQENNLMLREMKASHQELITIVKGHDSRIKLMEDLTKHYLGKRISRGVQTD
jgi:hypothetical protein